jgi:hypothetical protein
MRMLGWLLLAYAALGTILVVVALIVGGPMVARVDRLASSASGSMDAAARAAAAAAESLHGFDGSLAQAQQSTGQAAALSRTSADALDALSNAMGLNVLGAQPFLPLADRFKTTAEQMRDMGDSLGGIGQSLATNRTDAGAVSQQLDRLASEMAALQGGIAKEQSGASPPLGLLFYGFLAWQLLPIISAGIGGRLLLTGARAAE